MSLAGFVRRSAAAARERAERCELCSEPLGPAHRHLLELPSRVPRCACSACSLLFREGGAAAGRRYRLIPDRLWLVEGFELDDERWRRLGVPVGMACFTRDSQAGRVTAFYPSPAGPVAAEPDAAAWQALEAANPALTTLQADVEALLINRVRGARQHWLAPLDTCYALVGLVRTRWQGLGGGEVWEEVARFFRDLEARAVRVTRHGEEIAA